MSPGQAAGASIASVPMLKGISPLLSPELLAHLCRMGHGESIVLAGPCMTSRDREYFEAQVRPRLGKDARWVGELGFAAKVELLAGARCLLFPVQWEEPFGMSVIEALACGTPVVAMNRGAMPEIIEHGVNGFLANDEEEFSEYILRIDEIDPAACRRSVEEKFSAGAMAEEYLERYKEVLKLSKNNKEGMR